MTGPRSLPRRDLSRALVSLLALTGGVALVGAILGIALVGHAGTGLLQPVDDAVRRWVEAQSATTNPVAAALDAVFGSAGCVVIAGLAGLVMWLRTRRTVFSFVPMLSAALAGFVVFAVKAAVARPRPAFSNGAPIDEFSFPSGHVTSTTALVLTMILVWLPQRWRRTGAIAGVAVVASVALSRLVLGVHWASDVLVGVGLGGALGFGVARITDPVVETEALIEAHAEESPADLTPVGPPEVGQRAAS